MKICTKCGETKPSTEFRKNARTRDGLRFWCKDCLLDFENEKAAMARNGVK